MNLTIETIKKSALLLGCLFLSFLSISADDLQKSLNLDYFRTPEASAFKKYGEESVNEYTGTADISVPLYTIKCKDVEIPIVLRYDASGIKVEQEASWVGLGWNLMVGGCINYVCAGSTDLYGFRTVPNQTWVEYLTSEFGPWGTNAVYGGMYNQNGTQTARSQVKYYNYNANEESNWMANIPYNKSFVVSYTDQFRGNGSMSDYVDAGFGERDFYSVNVLGKSFKFFVDPFTLKIFTIGQAGEDFKVQTDPVLSTRGIAHKEEILKWIITDSDGYVYRFEQRERLFDSNRAWYYYTSCWYLTQIKTPHGEVVNFTYESYQKSGRATRSESISLPMPHQPCCNNAYSGGHTSIMRNANVTSHYLKEISTSNQTVSFSLSNCSENNGKKLDAITVKSKNNTVIKTINFSYGTFGYSNVGGNYAPASNSTAELRLKLNNVKETASQETHTTSFSYNSLNLPSKRSCAQDYWGYYNGQENKTSGYGYTLVPTPQKFMSLNYSQTLSKSSIKGANRFSCSDYMQAAILNRVDYPTGGYTTYEYEPNSILTKDFTLSETYIEEIYDVSILTRFTCYPNSQNVLVSDQSEQSKVFTLTDEATCDVLLQCSGQNPLHGKDMRVEIYRWNNQTNGYSLYQSIPMTFIPYSQDLTYILSVTLPAAKYMMTIIPINNNGQLPYTIRCYLNGWYSGTVANSNSSYTLTCGGLRVKRIRNYDSDGKQINYTTYDYNENGMTSGKLINKIETIDYDQYYNFSPTNGLPGTHTVNVFTFTPGHSRMPTFFESCSSGIVGYSKVTKSKYNANGTLEKKIVTTYRNDEPQCMKIDYFDHLDNGQMLSQEIYNASNAIAAKTVNTYSLNRTHYATNLITQNKSLHSTSATTDGVVNVLRYPYILSRVELAKSISTEYCPNGSTIVKTKNYSYNGINHQISQIDESTSISNQTRRTKITYSADGSDELSNKMKSAHWLNYVVENKDILVDNGQEKRIKTQHTTYANSPINGSSCYLPVSYSISLGTNALETRSTYLYDSGNNIGSVAIDGIETVYIWSYNGLYPIAKIEGLTYAAVKNAVGTSTISTILNKIVPSTADISSLRNAINNAGGYITTYSYKPLVGITSETLPNGNTIYYDYDAFGRLKTIKDNNQKTMKSYEYKYKR